MKEMSAKKKVIEEIKAAVRGVEGPSLDTEGDQDLEKEEGTKVTREGEEKIVIDIIEVKEETANLVDIEIIKKNLGQQSKGLIQKIQEIL